MKLIIGLSIVIIVLVVSMYFYRKYLMQIDSDYYYDFNLFTNYTPLKFQREITPSPITNILVYNSASYKDNKLPKFAELSININKAYCNKYGYKYEIIMHEPSEMPPYWLRVKDLYDILTTTSYEYVVYLDLDAIFNDFGHSIGQLIEVTGKYDMYTCQDIENYVTEFSKKNSIGSLLNTGCYIVKNTEWSRQFVKTWLNTCFNDAGKPDGMCLAVWNYDNSKSKWDCKDCKWAGNKYEQGALASLFVHNIMEARKHVCIFTRDVMCNMNPDKESFVLHLMGLPESYRQKVFAKKLKSLPSSHN